MQHLQPNTTLQGGKYKIESMLGQGGFGNTYSGYNTVFDERVAIKEFFMQGINDRDEGTGMVSVSLERNKQQFDEQREKFKKEALRVRKLNNPHIVRVHDLFEENGTAYYVMDYVDGENLNQRLKRTNQPLKENEVVDILRQVLDALQEVHANNIWHLDLKPANIMVDRNGTVKLIDFGASKQLNAQKGGATTGTAVSFTNGFAPREQMEQNYEKFGPWSDFYALGATIYNLLTNQRPPMPTDIDDDRSTDKHLALPLPSELTLKMKNLILWLMKTDRLKRPTKVEEIINFMQTTTKTIIPNIVGESDSEDTFIEQSKIKKHPIKQPHKQETSQKSLKTSNSKVFKGIVFIVCFAIACIIGYILLQNKGKDDNYLTIENVEIVDSVTSVTETEITIPQGKCTYTGEVNSDGIPNGKGQAWFKDGRYYKGVFINGNLEGDNAYFSYKEGDVFEGSFKNNMFEKGTYTIKSSGEYFRGTYKDGNPLHGKWFDKNGNLLEEI